MLKVPWQGGANEQYPGVTGVLGFNESLQASISSIHLLKAIV